jgi:Bacterial Ig-like domain (group 3)
VTTWGRTARPLLRSKRALAAIPVALGLLVGTLGSVALPATHALAVAPKALILGPTVTGSPSLEQTDLQNQGWTVTVVSGAAWDAMTALQFSAYQLLVFGDTKCGAVSNVAAAVTNESTWAPIANGNVIVIGTDPVFHNASHAGAGVLVNDGLAYAGAQAGKTGLYVDLSCYYGGSPGAASPLLDGIEAGFKVHGEGSCAATIHVVAVVPALASLTDADLSNWSCSVHEFFGLWPADFVPIGIDTASSGTPASGTCPNPKYNPPDGTTAGCPYIVGRGGGLKSGTSFAASATLANIPFGSSSTLAESGLPGAATGAVTFASGGSTLCTATLPATSCTTSTSLALGTYPITATYPGDATYGGFTTTTSLIVAIATSFTATATPATVAFGTGSTLAESGLPGVSTGTVTFASGGSTLCTATRPATTCATSMSLAAGSYAITATYSGDSTYAPSTASTSLTVTAIATSFTASATASSVAFGTSSTLAESGLPGVSTGTVTFASGGSTLCIVTRPATSCATSTSLAAGSYAITATYSGGGNYAGSTATTSLTVTRASAAFTATASPASVPFGTSSTLAESGLPGGATGTVTFASGGSTLCTATLPLTHCPTSTSLAGGVHSITATYSGDGSHAGSTASTTLTVTLAATVFTAGATPATVAFGATSALAESGLPVGATGTITFAAGGSTLCRATLPVTTCPTLTSLGVGTYAITATYAGDGNYASSTASTSLIVIPSATVTDVTSSLNPGASNQPITYTATVGPNPGGGTVTFTDNGIPIAGCTAVLLVVTTGTAVCATTYPNSGVHHIGATYNGNANGLASTAPSSGVLALVETIQAPVVVPATGVRGDLTIGRVLGAMGLGVLGLALILPVRRRRREAR